VYISNRNKGVSKSAEHFAGLHCLSGRAAVFAISKSCSSFWLRRNKGEAEPAEHFGGLHRIGRRLLAALLEAAPRFERLLPLGGSVSDAGWVQLAVFLAVAQARDTCYSMFLLAEPLAEARGPGQR